MLNFIKKIFNSIFCKKEEVKDEWQKDIIIWKSSEYKGKFWKDFLNNRLWVEVRLINKKRNITNTKKIILVANPTHCHENYGTRKFYLAKGNGKMEEGNLQDLFNLQDHWHNYLYDFIYDDSGDNLRLLVYKYEKPENYSKILTT